MPFPTTFSPELTPLANVPDLSQVGREATERLAARGIIMMSGLQEEHLPGILDIARRNATAEWCAKDASPKRFMDPAHWLGKGRGVFIGLGDIEIIGNNGVQTYDWTGFELCEELPDHPITTAFRTAIPGTGADIVIATVEGSRALHDNEHGYGLETWEQNHRARTVYERLGARLILRKTHEPNKETGELERIKRPTLDIANADLFVGGKPYKYDNRMFYALPEKF